MYGCKYLNFSRSVTDMELISRRCIRELEGLGEADANPDNVGDSADIPEELLAEYADPATEKHAAMVELIRKKLKFDSLKFQELPDLLDAIGVEPCKLCTYCWNGKE